MIIGWVQPGTSLGTLFIMIGSRKTVPPRILLNVPLGDFHICFKLYSLTRASSGVIVAHLILCNGQSPLSMKIWTQIPNVISLNCICRINSDLVIGRVSVLQSKVKILDIQVQIGKNKLSFKRLWYFSEYLFLNEIPNNARHFIPIEFNYGIRYSYSYAISSINFKIFVLFIVFIMIQYNFWMESLLSQQKRVETMLKHTFPRFIKDSLVFQLDN